MSEETVQSTNRRISIDLEISNQDDFVVAVNDKYSSNAQTVLDAIDVCVSNAFRDISGSFVSGWSKPTVSEWKSKDDLIAQLWKNIDEIQQECCHIASNPCPPTHNCSVCNEVDLG